MGYGCISIRMGTKTGRLGYRGTGRGEFTYRRSERDRDRDKSYIRDQVRVIQEVSHT